MEALVRGDDAVYSALMDEYYDGMRRLALSCVHDQDIADDVIQETWVAVVNGIDRFEGRSSLRTWVFRILLNLARRRANREQRFVPFDAPVSGAASVEDAISAEKWGAGQNPDDWIDGAQLVARVESALATLPPAQRTVMTLRDIEGWSSQEVCELLEISAANQRVLLHRARLRVRDALNPVHGPGVR
ncbi:MAG TPA: RNA polymerase sigma factor [Longimicrobiales bacterium]